MFNFESERFPLFLVILRGLTLEKKTHITLGSGNASSKVLSIDLLNHRLENTKKKSNTPGIVLMVGTLEMINLPKYRYIVWVIPLPSNNGQITV